MMMSITIIVPHHPLPLDLHFLCLPFLLTMQIFKLPLFLLHQQFLHLLLLQPNLLINPVRPCVRQLPVRKVQPGEYEAKHEFFSTKTPKGFEEIAKGGGWAPGGSGTLLERLTLSEDGKCFKSTIRYVGVDETGKPTETGSMAETEVTRIRF